MKRSTKQLRTALMVTLIFTVFLSPKAVTSTQALSNGEHMKNVSISSKADDSIIAPLADIIDWVYKFENNKMYRRLYNHSKQIWIGEWELC